MFSEISPDKKSNYNKDNFDKVDYEKNSSSFDIDDIVDSILSRKEVNEDKNYIDFLVDRELSKKNEFFDKKPRINKLTNWETAGKNFVKSKNPSVKKIAASVIFLILIFAIRTASLPQIYGSNDFDVTISISPDDIRDGDSIVVSVTIPERYNITSIAAGMADVETIDLTLVDSNPDNTIWEGVWIVHDLDPGEHIITIRGEDDENVSYSAGTRLTILAEEIPEDVPPSDVETNETTNDTGSPPAGNDTVSPSESNESTNETVPPPEGNESTNDTVPPPDGNASTNDTAPPPDGNETVPPDVDVNGTDNVSDVPDIPDDVNESVDDVAIIDLNVSEIFHDDFEDNGREPFIYHYSPENSIGISELKIVDPTYFWDYFNRYVKWDLELYSSDNDKWISYNEYLDISSIRSDNNGYEKTTLNFTLPETAQYRLTFTIEAGVKNYVNQTNEHEYILEYSVGDDETYTTFFNWSDIVNLPDITWDNGIARKGNRDVFWFRITSNDIVPEGTFVSIDPTFGNTDSASDSQVDIEDRTAAGYFQMGASDGEMTKITAYLAEEGQGTSEARAGLYDSSRNLLGSAFCDAEASGNNWVDFTFITPIPVSANSWYYIAVCGEAQGGREIYLRYDNNAGANGVFDDNAGTEDALPDPFAGNTVDDDGLACIYCTYSEFDGDPPTPNPMTWSTEPYNASSSSISMVATTASDDTPPISYYFNETTGNSGGTDSGWQAGTSYTDNGLSENTQYGYEVKARDNNGTVNEGNYSTPISYEYTSVDPPTDGELTFDIGIIWINATVAQPPNPTSGSTGSNFSWTTGGATYSDWQNGVYFHNRTGLTNNTNYGCQVQYRNGDGDASTFNPTEKTNYTLCDPPEDYEFTIDTQGKNWINMSVLDVDNNPTAGSTAAYFECVTGGASDSGWVTDSESGRYYYNATGLNSETTYGFRVKYRNADAEETSYTIERQQATGPPDPPTVTTNTTTGVEETNATLHGWLQDNGTGDTTCYFLLNDTNDFGSPIFNLSKGIIANGAEFENDTAGETTLTKGTRYYYIAQANNSGGWSNGAVQSFLTKPDPISSFTATTYGTTQINLTWTDETGGDGAYIEYAENSPPSPWNEGDGTPVDADGNVTTPFYHTSLTPGVHYYYKAWSYATDGGWTSNGNQSAPRGDNAQTADATLGGPPTVQTNESTGVEETNATLVGFLQSNGTTDTTCYFLWGTQNPPTDNNVTQGIIANVAEFSYDTSGTGSLSEGTLYYFDTQASNSQGWDESGGVKTFLTKPNPPSSLVAQVNSSSVIYLTWNTGTGYNTTYIERNTSGQTVWTRGEGTELYNGTGTNYEDTGLLEGVTYYYQAWSFANWTYDSTTLHQWSDNNASDNNKTNSIPTISNEDPTNESTGVSVPKQLGITVNDVDGDSMTITWYSNSSGSWLPFGTNVTGVDGNGTYHQTNSNFSNYSKTFYWNVSVSDGSKTNDSETFWFSTKSFVTSVDSISPYIVTTSPKTITATGDSALDEVTLYYRWSEDNQSWDPWNVLTYDDFESGFGSYTDGGGDCSLYTGGTYAHQPSNAANIQDDRGEASSFYHTSGIDVDTLGYKCIKVDFWFYTFDLNNGHNFSVSYYDGSAWQTVANYIAGTNFVNGQFYHEIVWINESSYTFPANMKLKFRVDALNDNDDVYIDEIYVNATTQSAGGNGVNWTKWSNANNPDTEYPWSWGFDFPNNTGYSEFYSIGNKSGSTDETAPASADTSCRFNRIPTITNEMPTNQSTNIQLTPLQMNITVNDLDSDTMNITWSSNSSGAWVVFGYNNSVGNGTYSQTNSNFTTPGETYWWNVTVNDILFTNSTVYYFTTSYQPILSNPGPSNGSTGQYNWTTCNVTVSDQDGGTVTVRFYENTTGSWIIQQTNSSVDVTTSQNIVWGNYTNASEDFTKYWWTVNVSDGKGNFIEEVYHFTTANTSINVTPANWDQGLLAMGSTNETTGFYFNLTSEGDTPLDIQIKATNATNSSTGAVWKLNATPTKDNYTLEYNLSGSGSWTVISLTYDTFVESLSIGLWQTFDLKLHLPPIATYGHPLSVTVTFRSVKS